PTVAANVGALVNIGGSGEQGLLGMAFDPRFSTSHKVYLTYTDANAHKSILARWVTTDGGLTFSPDSPSLILAIPHPFDNHNGGDIVFSGDGFLYYGMGDGGSENDPDDN